MYSQNDEELYILNELQENGHFLEIGAYDGKTFSNTLALVERGWSGVCVEPSPTPFTKLQELHRNNDKITLVNSLIGFNWGMRKFYDSPDAVATTEQNHYEKWKDYAKFRTIYVAEVPLDVLLREHPGPYDFISIDTESTSFELLIRLQLNILRPTLICVEYDNLLNETKTYLEQHNYTIIHTTSENILAKNKL